jgi:GTP-binding protein
VNGLVAIVGRPNVGKSTLFNRMVGQPLAIVSDVPGTTRDRIFGGTWYAGREVTLVDTGGLEPAPSSVMSRKVRSQVEAAIGEADVVIFLCDAIEGLVPADLEIADRLRRSGKPVVVAVNKADNPRLEANAAEFNQLGLGPVVALSAHHGQGIEDLRQHTWSRLPPAPAVDEAAQGNLPKLAIVGRPNVGKSTLLNTLAGSERAIVDDVSGTTRDALDTTIRFHGQDVVIIDTAGIRHRGKSGTGVDYYSLLRALRAIDRCHVAVLVMDSSELAAAQDMHVAQYLLEARKGVIIAINKWDLLPLDQREGIDDRLRSRIRFIPWAPVLHLSAKEGTGVGKLLPLALEVWHERDHRLPPEMVSGIIKESYANHPPPRKGMLTLKVYDAWQEGIRPPAFKITVNDPELVHFSYQRYLENQIRQAVPFTGTPITLSFVKATGKTNKGARK